MKTEHGEGGLHRKNKKFCLGHVVFQEAMEHASKNVKQTVTDAGLDGWGEFKSGEIDMRTISGEVILKAMALDVVTGKSYRGGTVDLKN